VCDLEKSKRGGLGPIWAVAPRKELVAYVSNETIIQAKAVKKIKHVCPCSTLTVSPKAIKIIKQREGQSLELLRSAFISNVFPSAVDRKGCSALQHISFINPSAVGCVTVIAAGAHTFQNSYRQHSFNQSTNLHRASFIAITIYFTPLWMPNVH